MNKQTSRTRRSITLTVGRLCCGTLRDFLNKVKLRGYDIEFHEGSGFFERDFTIAGDLKSINAIKTTIDSWMEDLEK